MPGKKHRYSLKKKLGGATQPFWTLWRRETFFTPPRIRTPGLPAHSESLYRWRYHVSPKTYKPRKLLEDRTLKWSRYRPENQQKPGATKVTRPTWCPGFIYNLCTPTTMSWSWDSLVRVLTSYWMVGAGFEFWQAQQISLFSKTSRQFLRLTHPHIHGSRGGGVNWPLLQPNQSPVSSPKFKTKWVNNSSPSICPLDVY